MAEHLELPPSLQLHNAIRQFVDTHKPFAPPNSDSAKPTAHILDLNDFVPDTNVLPVADIAGFFEASAVRVIGASRPDPSGEEEQGGFASLDIALLDEGGRGLVPVEYRDSDTYCSSSSIIVFAPPEGSPFYALFDIVDDVAGQRPAEFAKLVGADALRLVGDEQAQGLVELLQGALHSALVDIRPETGGEQLDQV